MFERDSTFDVREEEQLKKKVLDHSRNCFSPRWLDNLLPIDPASADKADEVTARAVSGVLDALDDAQCLQRDIESDAEYHDVIAAAFQVLGVPDYG